MLTAADATSHPQYGTFASSKSPCRVPSSPFDPCTSGIATSNRAAVRDEPPSRPRRPSTSSSSPAASGSGPHRHARRRGDQSIDVLVAFELQQVLTGVPRARLRDVDRHRDHAVGRHRRHRLLRGDHRHLVLDGAAAEEDADPDGLSHSRLPAVVPRRMISRSRSTPNALLDRVVRERDEREHVGGASRDRR